MFSFECDYHEGAHPRILQRLIDINLEQLPGYGEDEYNARAKDRIREACGTPEADVFFFGGGTQTNVTVIDSLLETYEGVISAETGHVNCHEAGGVEFTGHKVLTVPNRDGKVAPEDLQALLDTFWGDEAWEHIVFPGMLYISHPTELGTLYTKAELQALAEICHKYDMPLFLDGARLGYGLMSKDTDLSLPEIAQLCDVFYIGGTKVGALCGEAVVFTKNNRPKHFMTSVKKRGALLAKGRLLGIQFDALFTDDLYFRISAHAIEMAEQMKKLFKEAGLTFYLESPTNQQFVILENGQMEKLSESIAFSFWEKYDEDHTVVRFATSWSTTDEDMEALGEALKRDNQK